MVCYSQYQLLFRYTYKLGHQLFNGSYIWSKSHSFHASPYPGQNSLQQVIIFGDMGKVSFFFCQIFFTSPKSSKLQLLWTSITWSVAKYNYLLIYKLIKAYCTTHVVNLTFNLKTLLHVLLVKFFIFFKQEDENSRLMLSYLVFRQSVMGPMNTTTTSLVHWIPQIWSLRTWTTLILSSI